MAIMETSDTIITSSSKVRPRNAEYDRAPPDTTTRLRVRPRRTPERRTTSTAHPDHTLTHEEPDNADVVVGVLTAQAEEAAVGLRDDRDDRAGRAHPRGPVVTGFPPGVAVTVGPLRLKPREAIAGGLGREGGARAAASPAVDTCRRPRSGGWGS